MPTCKLCGDDVPHLARCHIYPRALSRAIAGSENVLVGVACHPQPRAAYARGGMFDDNIVCPSCEQRFKRADDYAIEFRKAVLELRPPVTFPFHEAKLPAFEASPELLHTFAMQTWLRSFLSERAEHDQLTDSAIAKQTIECLLRGESTLSTGRQIAYEVNRSDLGQMMLAPMHAPDFSPPIYELAMPNMAIRIAAGDGGLPKGFSDIALRPGKIVVVWRPRKMHDHRINQLNELIGPNVRQLDRMFKRG